jgi:hypothetical protein
MKMTAILYMYSSYTETRYLIRTHSDCIIENLVNVSVGEFLLLTEDAPTNWWRREDNIKVHLRKKEFGKISSGLR